MSFPIEHAHVVRHLRHDQFGVAVALLLVAAVVAALMLARES
jgi:hypothetical protein